ncbi:MAG: tetratricopeptide repeat protein [bacterium]
MKKLPVAAMVLLIAAVARGGSTNAAAIDDLLSRTHEEAQAGNNEAAAVTLEAALDRDPGNRDAAVALGRLYLQMSRRRDAIALLEPVMKAEPANFVLMNNIAWVRAVATEPDLFNPSEAVRLARAALALAPSDVHVWSTLSEALYAHGEFDEALRAAQQAVRLAEQDPRSGDGLTTYRAQLTKCGQALRALALVE